MVLLKTIKKLSDLGYLANIGKGGVKHSVDFQLGTGGLQLAQNLEKTAVDFVEKCGPKGLVVHEQVKEGEKNDFLRENVQFKEFNKSKAQGMFHVVFANQADASKEPTTFNISRSEGEETQIHSLNYEESPGSPLHSMVLFPEKSWKYVYQDLLR